MPDAKEMTVPLTPGENYAEGKSVARPIQKDLPKSDPTQQEPGDPKG